MKKLLRILTVLAASLPLLVATATPSAAMPKPPSVELVKASQCRVDFDRSVYWTGHAAELAMQISWLVQQLPKKCYEDKCVFVNIDMFYFMRLNKRFLEGKLPAEYIANLVKLMRQCLINVNMPRPISGTGSGGGCGNSLSVAITNSSNVTVTAAQSGCNSLQVTVLDSYNVNVAVAQFGNNNANLFVEGNNTSVSLTQNGNQNYSGNFGSNANIVVNQ